MLATLDQWGISGPCRFRSLADGTNNQMYRVDTPVGGYVLRIYSNHADLTRLRFEETVLTHLAGAGLPFAVPVPLLTTSGARSVVLSEGDSQVLCSLTPLILGVPPNQDDLAQATAAGEALGLLDAALARLDIAEDSAATSWRSYGDLAHCHPLVPDPPEAIRVLPLVAATRDHLLARYAWLMRRIPELYASLPHQLSHEDYGPSNVLLDGRHVTGVLDFEFCARDVRVMDLTVALSWWPLGRFGGGAEWPIIRAFVAGYARHVTLTGAEIAAILDLFELRAYTSLIHRLGRLRQGLSPLDAVTERASAALERHTWLAANGARLVESVGEIAAGGEQAN